MTATNKNQENMNSSLHQVKIDFKPNKEPQTGTVLTTKTDTPVARKRFMIPLFERSSPCWWNPSFDSQALEEQHNRSSLPQSKQRFRFALAYITLSCVVWCIFFGWQQHEFWIAFLAGTATLLVVVLVIFAFTFTLAYPRYMFLTSLVTCLVLIATNLFSFIDDSEQNLSEVGTFIVTIEIIMIMYTLMPLPLYLCVLVGVAYSVVFEVLSGLGLNGQESTGIDIGCRVFLHVAIHAIGMLIFMTTQVRKHSTFLKIGQSTMARCDLEVEKQVKLNMIHSLMPPKVAEEIMKNRERKSDKELQDINDTAVNRHHGSRHSSGVGSGAPEVRLAGPERGKMVFRTFHMSQLENVTILFADIVGFTKMSSNKSAEKLVGLLNELFGRFDDICTRTNCEKISTLGDCYYCVSGCPEPRTDHAYCCVEMGLQMCVAILEFDEEHQEEVNMRVGVHTGTVLCGLVGTRRFKFDVWSHDVTIANLMESEGRPGLVHLSDATYSFIKDQFEFEPGEPIDDFRKESVLVEDYNTETQQYVVHHVVHHNTLATWYVVGRTGEVDSDAHGHKLDETAGDTSIEQWNSETKDPASVGLLSNKLKNNNSVARLEDMNGKMPSDAAAAGGGVAHATAALSQSELDLKLIKSMNDCPNVVDYLYNPPINKFTLSFSNVLVESEYRRHYLDDMGKSSTATFSQPRISRVVDMCVSIFFFLMITCCCFFGFNESVRPYSFIVFGSAAVVQLVVFTPMLYVVLVPRPNSAMLRFSNFMSSWRPRHTFGAVVASMPTICVYSTFSCVMFDNVQDSDILFCLVVVVSLLHFCNFAMLTAWMKCALATVAGVVFIILLGVGVCPLDVLCVNGSSPDNVTNCRYVNESLPAPVPEIFSGQHPLQHEVIVDMLLLLILIWFLNHEIEISYRLCYHGNQQAVKDRLQIETERDQVNWLLNNIVPEHVASHIRNTDKFYCQTHPEVGIIFAKVSNFDDFYEQSFQGGKEYLRVLNELLGDFEDLFDLEKYRDIEKIKTIGSCLMAASGLNPMKMGPNRDPNAHLYELMDFSLDILKKIEAFNKDMFNFNFVMSIGYNFGEVTAGVVGSTKLLYDIWGDSVNIASRMYSTGVHQRIQVTEKTKLKLESKFDFEYRGTTSVKGKGEMQTYLVVGKKAGATWN